jgi:hypothetical protein
MAPNPADAITNMNFALPSGSATIIAIAMLGVTILGIAGFLFWKAKTYKHRAIILEDRNGQLVEFKVQYRYKIVRLAEVVKFWGSKKYVEKPSQDYIRRINGRDVIYYAKGNDNYVYPVKYDSIDENTKTIKQRISKSDADFWATLRIRNEIDRWSKKTFFEQYGGIMMAVIFAVIFIIGNWIIWNGIRDAVGPIGDTGAAVREAAIALNNTNAILAKELGIALDNPQTTPTGQTQNPGGIITIPGGN